MAILEIVNLVLGIVLLTTGKKLYWLFVAIVGFLVGYAVTTQYLHVQLNPMWLIYIIAVGAGVIGAILATFLQHLAIALVGFIVGGYGAIHLVGLLGITNQVGNLMAFVIGGIIGLLLVASVFNWALYLLSSWAGATLVTQAIGLQGVIGTVIFFALFVLGMIIQVGLFREQPKKEPKPVRTEPTETKQEGPGS
jgi:MFS family permease